MIGIVEYGSGNVAAIMNVLKRQKIPHFLSGNPTELQRADRFILPGVGAFDPTMEVLNRTAMIETLREEVHGKGKKILGICVGMHLLADGSDEGGLAGLGWIPGQVTRIDAATLSHRPHLPHMGWNSLELSDDPIFEGLDADMGFYFLHSFYFKVADPAHVIARVKYGTSLPCAVRKGNVYGVQFHPEKSHANGMRLLKNYAELV